VAVQVRPGVKKRLKGRFGLSNGPRIPKLGGRTSAIKTWVEDVFFALEADRTYRQDMSGTGTTQLGKADFCLGKLWIKRTKNKGLKK
jgi:hypothetical protein